MNKTILQKTIKRIANKRAIIVGAGKRGELSFNILKENGIITEAFFDNDNSKDGTILCGLPVMIPRKLDGDYCYLISVEDSLTRRLLRDELIELGIAPEIIIIMHFDRDYDYMTELPEDMYKAEISDMFRETFGYDMDWDNPRSYNEIINWEKINCKDDRRTMLADKYLVREWVSDRIGYEHVTELYGVWDDPDDIKFANLPDRFVLKLNNGSGRNIVIKNRNNVDFQDVRDTLRKWMGYNYAYGILEMHYKSIEPRIICEEYLDGIAESLYDYNVFCFHGEPKYIWCIKGSHKPDCVASFYDTEWKKQPFSFGYPLDPVLAPKPERLGEMLELTRNLCKEFEHVRVDWYIMPDGRVLFGEMTFSSWGGVQHFAPEEYDLRFGKLIKN